MPLVLQPTYDDKTRQEIEAHLEQVRARRLVAAIEYHNAKAIKIERMSQVIERRMRQQYELLGKDILRLDALDEKIQDRLNKLEMFRQENDLIEEQI